MKKYILLLLATLALTVSCDVFDHTSIWDKLNEHEQRIEELEKACNRLNTNIESIQTILQALQTNDYVADITKIMEDGVEVGYSITFAKGGTVTIYHGTSGEDGSTPKIGIKKASDGQYYWTSDGEWLTGEDGEKIPATVAAGDGKYITPQFRIADGVWYISYDNGNSWRKIESVDSEQDAFFQSVSCNSDYVYFILADGTEIAVPIVTSSQSFRGAVISILGDSISTFAGWLPVEDGHNLNHSRYYPKDYMGEVQQTWWHKLINNLGAKLGVNDSWSGSRVHNDLDANEGNLGPDACMASITRITNLGANGTPDLIFFYGGTNDAGKGVEIGTFNAGKAHKVDLTATKWDTFADAYAAAIMRLQYYYPEAKIIAMTPMWVKSYYSVPRMNQFAEVIQQICDYFGVAVIDLRKCGINANNIGLYLGDGLHPNVKGMEMMEKYIRRQLFSFYEGDYTENVVYSVINNLSSAVNKDRYIKGVSAGKPYSAELTGNLKKICVKMAGQDITYSTFDSNTGMIYIPDVQGDILIDESGSHPTADLLDVVFLEDGTAKDASPMQLAVQTFADEMLLRTHYDSGFGDYVASFDHSERYTSPQAGTHKSGYYKINYAGNSDFIKKLSDGHTMETLFMMDAESPNKNFHDKWFCSQELGGTGFFISKSEEDNMCISFSPSVSINGSSEYILTYSGVTPVKGQWYHAVGVWDKAAGKTRIYINGVEKGSMSCPTDASLYLHSDSKFHWFCVGADVGNGGANYGWDGNVAIARVYDKALTEEEVEQLYKDAQQRWPSSTTPSFSNVQCFSGVEVAEGWKYSVYADGIKSGDILELQSKTSQTRWNCQTVSEEGRATLTIPQGLTSGDYYLIVNREGERVRLRTISMTVDPKAELPHETKVIAHRGYWYVDGGTSLPHNSLASLSRAQQLAGAHSAECDIWMTKDNVLVLNHDATISGINIQNSNYSSIKDCKLSNGEKLVTFDSYLDQYAKDTGIKLMIHIKTHSTAARTIECASALINRLRDYDLLDKAEWLIGVYSVASHIVEQCKDEVSDLVVYYTNDDVVRTYAQLAEEGMTLNYNYATIQADPGCIKRAHQAGLEVVAWTIDTTDLMLEFMSLGVDYFNTNRPDLLIALKKKTFIEK